tara:strand:+ start:270 stop:548 length:279 start_codon:yes stop_codon:yes gene_type:complete
MCFLTAANPKLQKQLDESGEKFIKGGGGRSTGFGFFKGSTGQVIGETTNTNSISRALDRQNQSRESSEMIRRNKRKISKPLNRSINDLKIPL